MANIKILQQSAIIYLEMELSQKEAVKRIAAEKKVSVNSLLRNVVDEFIKNNPITNEQSPGGTI